VGKFCATFCATRRPLPQTSAFITFRSLCSLGCGSCPSFNAQTVLPPKPGRMIWQPQKTQGWDGPQTVPQRHCLIPPDSLRTAERSASQRIDQRIDCNNCSRRLEPSDEEICGVRYGSKRRAGQR
jgi:hypothetical protein